MRINKKQLKVWIAALDSGVFKQGTQELQNKAGYCCLGVACKVLIKKPKMGYGFLTGVLPGVQPKAPKWLVEINNDFEKRTGEKLSDLNDNLHYKFTEIATLLELVYIHKILD